MSPEHMAQEMGLSCGSEILTAGFRACRICLIIYPFSLKVVLRTPTHECFPYHTEH